MSDTWEDTLETELESLTAIYVNELTYSRKPDGTVDKIELLLHPATGHDITKQYVCMTLVFTPSSKYPDEPPHIEIRNPRGLGEEEISSLVEDMVLKAEDLRGEPMLYMLIEMAKDSLTEGNIPHCPCVVCLEHFDRQDRFHRTACYHYFHSSCLYKYLLHFRAQLEEDEKDLTERRHLDFSDSDKDKTKKIICPVCRSPLDEESLAVACSPEELEETEKAEEFVVPPSLKEQQLKMAELYERQKAKGGIIDLEHERNKYLVNPEDRMPIRNVTPTSVTAPARGGPGKLSEKRYDAGDRDKNKIKSVGSKNDRSQQFRNRGKGRGQVELNPGRTNREWYNHKSRPSPKTRVGEDTSGASSQSSRNKVEEIQDEMSRMDKLTRDRKTEEFRSQGKVEEGENGRETGTEMQAVDAGTVRNGECISEVDGRGLKDECEERLSEDACYLSSEHEKKESQKQTASDVRTERGHKDLSIKTDDRGDRRTVDRQRRGKYRGSHTYSYHSYREKENVHYKERTGQENVTSKGVSKEGQDDEMESKEEQASNAFRGPRDRFSSKNKEPDRFKGKSGEFEGGRGKYKNVESGSTDGGERDHDVTDRENESRRASVQHKTYDDTDRGRDRGGVQQVRQEYDDNDKGHYQRDDSYRSRGSGPRYRSSKFHEGKSSHAGYSQGFHARNERPHQHHSSHHHQQQWHRHGRRAEGRERTDRPQRDPQESSLRNEDGEDSSLAVGGARETDAPSEAETQDEEEADLWEKTTRLQFVFAGIDKETTRTREIADISCPQPPGYDGINEASKTDGFTPETGYWASRYQHKNYCGDDADCRDGNENEGKNVGCICTRENIGKKLGNNLSLFYVGHDEQVEENWDEEIDIYEYERYLIRPAHLEEYDRQAAPRKKYYQDKLMERCELQKAIADEERRMMKEKMLRESKRQVTCIQLDSLGQTKESVDQQEDSRYDYFKGSNNIASHTQSESLPRISENVISTNDARLLNSSKQNVVKENDAQDECGYNRRVESASHVRVDDPLELQNVDSAEWMTNTDDVFSGSLRKARNTFTETKHRQWGEITLKQKSEQHDKDRSTKLWNVDHVPSTSGNSAETSDVCSSVLPVAARSPELSQDIFFPSSLKDSSFVGNTKTGSDAAGNLYKDIPQSFINNFKKAPPLKFGKKKHQDKARSSSKTAGDIVPQGNRSLPVNGSCHRVPEQAVGCRLGENRKEGFTLAHRIPLLQPTSSVVNTQQSAETQSLSAALLDSYITSSLLCASLQSDSSWNPSLFSPGMPDMGSLCDFHLVNCVRALNVDVNSKI